MYHDSLTSVNSGVHIHAYVLLDIVPYTESDLLPSVSFLQKGWFGELSGRGLDW